MTIKPNPRRAVTFIESMQGLAVSKLPEGPLWTWEIKLDGYRCEAVKSRNKVRLYSRVENSLNEKHPYIVDALRALPNDPVIDGELVALKPKLVGQFEFLEWTGKDHLRHERHAKFVCMRDDKLAKDVNKER